MNDKSEAFKKIKIQMNKSIKKPVSEEERIEIVQGLINANIPSVDNTIIESEMPEQIMGISVNWNELKIKTDQEKSYSTASQEKPRSTGKKSKKKK